MALPCTVTLESALAQSVRETVLDGLRSYNRRHAPPPEFQVLTLSARDDHGRVIGGLVGETGWRWLPPRKLQRLGQQGGEFASLIHTSGPTTKMVLPKGSVTSNVRPPHSSLRGGRFTGTRVRHSS